MFPFVARLTVKKMGNHTTGIDVLQNSFMTLDSAELQAITYITPKVIKCRDKLLHRGEPFVTGFFVFHLTVLFAICGLWNNI